MAHLVFILIGKSATGKDTIYARLLQDPSLHLYRVVPYTTRPIRSGEKEGEAYHFVSQARFFAMREEGRIIESRRYDTCYGPWYYFTTDDGQLSPLALEKTADDGQLSPPVPAKTSDDSLPSPQTPAETGKSAALLIGTLESYLSIRDYFARAKKEGQTSVPMVIPLYIEVEEQQRRQRAMAREAAQDRPRFDELERRLAADEKDFSEEKIKAAGITRRFVNQDLDMCVGEIADYIRSYVG